MTTTTPTANANGAAPITGGGPTHHEAPASATVKATHAATGYEWLITTRCDSTRDLLARIEHITTWLADNGWTPATSKPAAPSTSTIADAPVCPTHNTPMKQGRNGWYCPQVVGPDDGTGKPVYCRVRR